MAQPTNKRTYYKRALPSPPAIAFSSTEGRKIFAEALPLGTMVGFFKLIEQFTTQEEPQFCGLAALSMTLNALGIDPRRTWKGAWRWFSETMLDCCKSIADIKRDGITLSQAACLARCNGADVSLHRYGSFDGVTFRRLLMEVCASESTHMVVSYSRKAFKQSGDGHFSPIGGYNPVQDLVLILDVARFKYAPHWVRVDELLEAMGLLDPAVGRPRGFLLLSSRRPRESALFVLDPHPSLHQHSNLCGSEPGLRIRSELRSPGSPEPPPEQHLECELADVGGIVPQAAEPAPTAGPAAGLRDFSGSTSSGLGESGSGPAMCTPSPEPLWAAAHRFLTYEAGALVRRLMAGSNASAAAGSGRDWVADVEPHDGDGEEGEEQEAETTPTRSMTSVGSGTGQPSVEALVGELVAAAPLEGVCALVMRRPPVQSSGELQRGPCCGCEVAGGGKTVVGGRRDAKKVVAPCNSLLCRGEGSGSRGVQERLTAAAVAAVDAKNRCGSCGDGHGDAVAGSTLGGFMVVTAQVATGQDRAGLQPPLSPLKPTSAEGTSRGELVSRAAVNSAPSVVGDMDAGINTRSGPVGRLSDTCGNEAARMLSCSDVGSLDSAPSSESSLSRSVGSSQSACSMDSGSSSCINSNSVGGGIRRCCHGEPLEHHCVPLQVQALVADELRFTHMFQLVNFWLRRHRGCNHISPPDLTAFMRPAASAAAAGADASSGTGAETRLTAAAAEPVQAPGPAEAAAPPLAASVTTPRFGGHGARRYGAAATAPDCMCGDLGLPEWAAEKLTVALLLMAPTELEDFWQQQEQQLTAGAAAVRVCGRLRCRRCRQRAAAAGDRAAALVLLRERWQHLMQLAPLGLFASAPVLAEELAFLRLQLGQLALKEGVEAGQ